MNTLLATLILTIVPAGGTHEVPLAEINCVYAEDDGRHRLTQLIIWDKQHGSNCFHVRAWAMKSERIEIRSTGDKNFPYLIVWPIDTTGFVRIIKVRRMKTSHTYKDLEEEDRKQFPIEARVPLH